MKKIIDNSELQDSVSRIFNEHVKELSDLLTGNKLTRRQGKLVVDYFAEQKTFHVMEAYLKAGVPIRKHENVTCGVLASASRCFHLKLVKWLLSQGADIQETMGDYLEKGFEDIDQAETALDYVVRGYHESSNSGMMDAADAVEDFLISAGAKYRWQIAEEKKNA